MLSFVRSFSDLERERIECQRRREKDARRQEDERIQSRIHYEK